MPLDIRIGCASWNVPLRFVGDAPSDGSHLQRYAGVFDCMEINSSFRRRHKPETWARWRDSVPNTFRFSVKAPSAATHGGSLDPAPLAEFFADISELREKLGPVLVQLPPKLAFDAEAARSFFRSARELFDGPLVCEPRHASWFNEAAEGLMKQNHVARVLADPVRVPGGRKPADWAGIRYYRLHGSPQVYYSEYSPEFLAGLASDVRTSKVPTWCIFDNTASGAAFGNALQLQRLARPL